MHLESAFLFTHSLFESSQCLFNKFTSLLGQIIYVVVFGKRDNCKITFLAKSSIVLEHKCLIIIGILFLEDP